VPRGDHRDDLGAQGSAERPLVDHDALRARLVDHAEGEDDGHAGFDDFQREIEVAREGGRVRHDQHEVGAVRGTAEDGVDRDLFVARACAEAVGAGEIDDLESTRGR
jgi:hypothetical protein